ncbi:hypothetical protein F3N42_11250 [Marinihelvus fidelis]|uniref:Solute-binding protein family 5 domain-containing protein n=1 Tax=Marinihelvus fidelis TaxID=2613842 RepID=A0A5N0T8X2_9GAMM|nr:ABC transporter substrate-binding protein [Marinihelvus fidelis]KAA9130924.1 hypothetical protein F3N42_11250 [Marinihelvus fidelis]
MKRLLPLLLLMCACSDQATGPDGSTYVHSMDGAPDSLDPAWASTIYANTVVVNLYDTLYRYQYLARPYALAPNLAAAMPESSEDGLTVTIRIKPGVHFVDDPAFPGGAGREVTAADVIYSIQRHFDPATRARGAWLWRDRIVGLDEWKDAGADYDTDVAGLVALDSHTLQVHLTRPYPQFVHTLAQGYAGVVPREAVEAYGRAFGAKAVGSGPFRLVSFDSARVVMDRNPGFRAETFDLAAEGYDAGTQSGLGLEPLQGRTLPLIDRLEVEFIAEDAARWNALRGGEIDYIKVPAAQFDQVLATRKPLSLVPDLADEYAVAAAREAGFVYTNFDMSNPLIGHSDDPDRDERNRALRCAIIRGFDWEQRNERFFSGIGAVFPGIIPPDVPEHDPAQDRTSVQRDVEGARALLAENGWTAESLPTLTYGYPSSVTERQMFEQFRAFMADIGYPHDRIKPLVYARFGDYQRAYSEGEVMLITSGWTMDYPDSENLVQLFYGPHAAPGANSASYSNPEYDALFEQAAPMPPSPARTELYRRMNQMVIDDCATISGLSRTLVFMWQKDARMLPDRSFTGGYFLRFVDMASADE